MKSEIYGSYNPYTSHTFIIETPLPPSRFDLFSYYSLRVFLPVFFMAILTFMIIKISHE